MASDKIRILEKLVDVKISSEKAWTFLKAVVDSLDNKKY